MCIWCGTWERKKITWKDRALNDEIYRRSGLAPMTDRLIERNWRWTSHVHRMDAERLPKQLLYSQLSSGAKNQGRPGLRFKEVVKRNLKWSDVSLDTWLENGQSGKPWFEDHNIEQSSSIWQTANDDDGFMNQAPCRTVWTACFREDTFFVYV